MVKELLAGLRRWWLRKFRGIVMPPARYGGQGTIWWQHAKSVTFIVCKCGWHEAFTREDYVILSQDHREEIHRAMTDALDAAGQPVSGCSCPVTEARYVKICPRCQIGHWKQA